jgi:hypothetical protein
MAISYHGIIGNKAKVTLPSAEGGWYKNKNILRDPPKSITTRRIDKVNQDGSLNEMMYHNGDRIAENINVFARGVNPMVAVEYTSQGGAAVGAPGKLPYRIMNGGAYRPPQFRQEQLLPLSRQNRNLTSSYTNKAYADFSKTIMCGATRCASSMRQIKESTKIEVKPTKTMNIQMPVKEHFELKYIVENPTTTSASTNKRAKSNLQMINRQNVKEALKEINQYTHTAGIQSQSHQNYIHGEVELQRNIPAFSASTTKTSSMKKTLAPDYQMLLNRNTPQYITTTAKSSDIHKRVEADNDIVLDRNLPAHIMKTNIQGDHLTYLEADNDMVLDRNLPEYAMTANKTDNLRYTAIDRDGELVLNRNLPEYAMTANKTDNSRYTAIDRDGELVLERNLPEYAFQANLSDITHQEFIQPDSVKYLPSKTHSTGVIASVSNNKTEVEINRDFRLPEPLRPGSFDGKSTARSNERITTYNPNYTTNKRDIMQKIINERY